MTFLEYWKRKSASLAHHWDCMGFQEEEERPRPDFAAKAPYLEKNPITGVREPSFPQSKRYKRIAAGTGLILLMVRDSQRQGKKTLLRFFFRASVRRQRCNCR